MQHGLQESDVDKLPARAAQYVRMSTDHQRYSIDNQTEAIAAYAARRGLTVVKTYRDEGKSGLDIGGREGLQSLIRDVKSGNTDFDHILVYDISRWGRFQDADESAYYEFICKEAGIRVHYCAEQFDNDGGLASTIIKNVKRVMAGEYSRELSTKVFIGQCRLAKLGFWQGGTPPLGLRRLLVDENRLRKFLLTRGQQKSLQTDRVILTPGPDDELEIVHRIFTAFVVDGKTRTEIARELNGDGLLTGLGNPWSPQAVHDILTSEYYIGNNVFNRASLKLKQKAIPNPPHMWIRCENAFKPVLDRALFDSAQDIIARRREGYSDTYMLDSLAALWREKGRLNVATIVAAPHLPHAATYHIRFGSLVNAYERIGYDPGRNYQMFLAGATLQATFDSRVQDIISNIERHGGAATLDRQGRVLTINDMFTVAVGIAWCRNAGEGVRRWQIYFRRKPTADLCLVICMDDENRSVRGYYLLPTAEVRQVKGPQLYLDHPVFAATYRHGDLETFYGLCSREEVREAA